MRYVVVKRVTVLLGLLFVLAAGVFAWLVRDEPPSQPAPRAAAPPDAPAGAALFERHCAQCHDASDLGEQLRAGGEPTRAKWGAFLEEHGDAGTEADRLILEYLASGKAQN